MREIITTTLQGLAVLASFVAAAICYGLAVL